MSINYLFIYFSAPYNIRNLNDAAFSNPLGTKQCKVSGVLYNHSQKVLFISYNFIIIIICYITRIHV